jgi:hypothetical protein
VGGAHDELPRTEAQPQFCADEGLLVVDGVHTLDSGSAHQSETTSTLSSLSSLSASFASVVLERWGAPPAATFFPEVSEDAVVLARACSPSHPAWTHRGDLSQ